MQYFLEHLRHYTGVVTVSADGQYVAEDVLRLARALHRSPKLAIVATREFPSNCSCDRAFRPLLADRILRVLFRAFTGIAVSDVHTRLRALPTGLLPRLLRVGGDRFEYELAALLDIARSGYPLAEHAVAGNVDLPEVDSEFRPVADSIRMVRALMKCTPVDPFTVEQATDEASRNSEPTFPVRSPGAKQTR
jgi:hypothetical protein